MKGLPRFLKERGEGLAAAELGELQAVLTDQVELGMEPGLEEKVLGTEEVFLGMLDDSQRAVYRQLEQGAAAERRQALEAAFWRGVKLGAKMGEWFHE